MLPNDKAELRYTKESIFHLVFKIIANLSVPEDDPDARTKHAEETNRRRHGRRHPAQRFLGTTRHYGTPDPSSLAGVRSAA